VTQQYQPAYTAIHSLCRNAMKVIVCMGVQHSCTTSLSGTNVWYTSSFDATQGRLASGQRTLTWPRLAGISGPDQGKVT
jgi:hypothetical protein